ncbi:Alpha-1D adrenergic receptor [Saguinus oedipus]|uniref:Alpha-1D adrenergic receptor n=1 Tax=Saguinus oedipus TaxID=9490 RepID=A0ABQ9VKL9_SAGOE|nr:Alpha-1D adrenergic receptor [Saguinus oedipus]
MFREQLNCSRVRIWLDESPHIQKDEEVEWWKREQLRSWTEQPPRAPPTATQPYPRCSLAPTAAEGPAWPPPTQAANQCRPLPPTGSLFPQLKPSEGVFKVIFWLGYFNSCVNPLIYPCSSREFKRAFLRLLRCQCRRRRRRRPLWRVYGHHWRASTSGLRQDCAPSSGSAPPGAPLALTALPDPDLDLPGMPEMPAPVVSRRKPPSAFREWRLLGPLRKPTTQLRAKVSSLSHRIRIGGAQRAEAACAQRSEVEAVSLGVPHDVTEGATCQAYELADYSNLRETDI